jgi:hypothetical protein
MIKNKTNVKNLFYFIRKLLIKHPSPPQFSPAPRRLFFLTAWRSPLHRRDSDGDKNGADSAC